MKQRLNAWEKGTKAMKALYSLGTCLEKSATEQSLLNLIYFRVSQINGCAYCLDMHSKDLCAEGESDSQEPKSYQSLDEVYFRISVIKDFLK